jgi:hypothetical protein
MSEDIATYGAEHTAATMSAACDQIATALSKAQAAMQAAKKDSANPHFGSRYSSLAEVWDAIREPLTRQGLSVVQLPSATGAAVTVETLLMHVSGQWFRSRVTFPLRPEFSKSGAELPPSAQQIGSAITYGRRYGLTAMVGVSSADEDDDGNAASRRTEQPPAADQPPKRKLDPARIKERVGSIKPLDDNPSPVSATAFNARLYEACEAAGVTLDELEADLKGRGILKGAMKIDNLGEPIVNALLDGTDAKTGRRNWDLVVGRIKAARK